MQLNGNLIIVCVTCLMIVHMLMRGIFEIVMAKNSGNVMNNNFKEVINNLEKIKEESENK